MRSYSGNRTRWQHLAALPCPPPPHTHPTHVQAPPLLPLASRCCTFFWNCSSSKPLGGAPRCSQWWWQVSAHFLFELFVFQTIVWRTALQPMVVASECACARACEREGCQWWWRASALVRVCVGDTGGSCCPTAPSTPSRPPTHNAHTLPTTFAHAQPSLRSGWGLGGTTTRSMRPMRSPPCQRT